MMARAYAGFTLAQMKSVADGLSNQLAAANARIAEMTAESQRDALDRQAALDEANSRITSYEQQFGEYCKGAKSDMDYWKQRADIANTEIEKLRREIAELRRGEGSAE